MRLLRAVSILLIMPTIAWVIPSVAATVETRLTCPRNVEAGSSARIDLHIENQVCSARSVRILSTVVGNGDNTTGGVAILGPAVADNVQLPAAIDLLPTNVCSGSFCSQSFDSCTTDSDCDCQSITPGVADVAIVIPTPIPIGFDGTVVKQFIFTDGMDGSKTISDECLIAVPEPGIAMQSTAALTLLALLSRRADRAQNHQNQHQEEHGS